jgi:hypothetical protein
MMGITTDLYAVVTGDIVGFSELSNRERREFHTAFRRSSQKLLDFYAGYLVDKPEIFRGDSWQFTIHSIAESLRIALLLRALIRSCLPGSHLDVRMSIGIGTVDYLPNDDISSGDGPAYRISGEGLESIERPYRMTIGFQHSLESLLTQALQVILTFIDLLAKDWTEAQSEAIAGALVGLTQETIAKEWVETPVTQPAIAQHLERAGWAVIRNGLDYFESSLHAILMSKESAS